jgi:hypothetical protein
MCPVCSIGIAVSLGLSKWLGVDDSITGVWAGALILALSLWTLDWLFKKRDERTVIFLPVALAFYWALTFIPLYAIRIISNTNCLTFWGLNRLVFGSLLGIVLAILAVIIDRLSRRLNSGKKIFSYQKIVIPTGILLIASIILYFICK